MSRTVMLFGWSSNLTLRAPYQPQSLKDHQISICGLHARTLGLDPIFFYGTKNKASRNVEAPWCCDLRVRKEMKVRTRIDSPSPSRSSFVIDGPRFQPDQREKRSRYPAWYVNVHCICFFLYAVLGKGFAYAGISPIFVGEALLLCGLCLAVGTGKLTYLAHKPIGFLLIVFSLWELACTLPFVDTYGMDTFRDAVLWAYSIFAWIVASLVLRLGDSIELIIQRFRKYGGFLVILALISFLVTEFMSGSLPTWPGTAVSIPLIKGGDMLVHLAGAMSFLVVGLGVRKAWWVAAALGGFLAGSMANRGGAVAFILAVVLAFVLFPRLSRLRKTAAAMAVLLLGLVLLSAVDVRIKLPKSGKVELSADQLVNNIGSIVGRKTRGADADLDQTKRWRLEWWSR